MNTNSSLVSIFILCYNHEEYVSEAIESVINQTYQNIEIVIVDNASTDNSRTIIESYVMKDERIKFFSMEYNTLPSYGSNYAINQCNGDFIAALSADDVFMPNKIQIQLDYMLEFNLDLSFTWINTINSNSELLPLNFTESWFNRNDVQNKTDILIQYIEYKNVTNAITVMFRKSFLFQDKFYDHRLLQTQDYDLWIRLLLRTDNVGILQQKLTNYRILDNGSNLSLDKSNNRINRTHFEMIHVFKNFVNYPSDLLSTILQVEVNDDNKFESLYNKFEQEKNLYGQLALLLYLFQDLGENCDVHSKKFEFFFENYGKIDIRYLELGEELEKRVELLNYTLKEKDENIEFLNSEILAKEIEIKTFKKNKIYKFLNKIGLI